MFRKIAHTISDATGSSYAFFFAILIIVGWAYMGSHYNYDDTWQLVINTGTTIITFLMVFLIQNTQNRDTKAINLKLDEIIKTSKKARNEFIDIEDDSDEEIETIEKEFKILKK